MTTERVVVVSVVTHFGQISRVVVIIVVDGRSAHRVWRTRLMSLEEEDFNF